MARNTEIILDDLIFGEGPRWRAAADSPDNKGWLYFSDFHDHHVRRVDENGTSEVVVKLDDMHADMPSGLGWLPDGRMLIVSMAKKHLLVYDGNTLAPYADLSALAPHHCNDMVVDAQGNAYVGNFGFDIYAGEEVRDTNIILVRAGGSEVEEAASGLAFPNGSVITPDGKTLIVGESYGARLSAFDINPDATLSNHRIWADMSALHKEGYAPVPDGICLDEAGAIWVASPSSNDVLRIGEGGELLETISIDRGAFACMLGGADGKTLYICAAPDSNPKKLAGVRGGHIIAVRVDVPHAGRP